MKLKSKLCVGGALFFSLGCVVPLVPARAQVAATDMDGVLTESAEAFTERYNGLYKANKWEEMQRVATARALKYPGERDAWYAKMMGAYMQGDVDVAIKAGEARLGLSANANVEKALATLRAVRANFPGAQFQPIEFVESDASQEQAPTREKTRALLQAKDYAGLDLFAAELQKSNASDLLGQPFLQTLFDIIASPTNDPAARLAELSAWQKARPDSVLPRLALIKYWFILAYNERGGGYASTITPEMNEKIESILANATRGINELPASAHDSPLLYVVLQEWARLAGPGRPFLNSVFAEGAAQFPNYLPIYLTRATSLLPRWFGQPGEWEALAKTRADQIGGTEGDIFYALIFMEVNRYASTLKNEPIPEEPFDMKRFWRGFEALRAKHPDSVALRSAQIAISDDQSRLPNAKRDLERAKSALSEPNGHVIDNSSFMFRINASREKFGGRRMNILAAPKPPRQNF